MALAHVVEGDFARFGQADHGPGPQADVAPLAVNGQALNPGAGISDDVEVQSIAPVGMTPALHRLQGGCLECHVRFSLARVLYQFRRTLADIGGRCQPLMDADKLMWNHQLACEFSERSATWKGYTRLSRQSGIPCSLDRSRMRPDRVGCIESEIEVRGQVSVPARAGGCGVLCYRRGRWNTRSKSTRRTVP